MKMNKAEIKMRSWFFIGSKMIIVLLMPLMVQCQGRLYPKLPYDLVNPVEFQLSKELKEISGIILTNNRLYAITDNTGTLFELDISNGDILNHWQFAKRDDYEDVAMANGRFYVLNSNGNIFSFSLPVAKKPDVLEFKFPFGKGNEFEILYYDKNVKHLVMICKECSDDQKNTLSAYNIDPATGNYSQASVSIDATEAAKKQNSKATRLKPSAAALHPQTGEVYMVSSINKMLVRMNRNGKVLSVNSLKRSLFEQPEGITFTTTGDMLISNEAGNKKSATLLLIKKQFK